ncbi:hypothetical protein ABT224_28165 [Streptomyces sp. NPDC001584]|uniref:hypothetical protein n=1 Tax=Streptomyces sp. NPDC001584 TaxID=3154521 RepID=UPI00332914E7
MGGDRLEGLALRELDVEPRSQDAPKSSVRKTPLLCAPGKEVVASHHLSGFA